MVDMKNFSSKREYLNRRLSALKSERSSFDSHWMELSEFIQPRRGRFFVSDRNKGNKRHNKIINSKATQALRHASSGLMANLTSPARPWFRLEVPDAELMESAAVKLWLEIVEEKMRAVFNESNLYNALPVLYTDLLLFGTGAMSHVADFEDIARFHPHPVGSYYIALNPRGQVDTFAREFEWTTERIVREFGIENVSPQIKDQYDRGDYGNWWRIVHFVEPNPDYDPNREEQGRYKRYRSCYYEPHWDRDVQHDKMLRQSGFDQFPVYVPRWDVTGEDIYATNCPGMTALGDVKGLQIEERNKAMAIQKLVNPPLKGPGSLLNVPVSSLPGGITTYDSDTTREGLQPIYQVDPRLNELLQDIQAIENRIDTAFFVDLFLAITNMRGIQPRNQLELMQRDEEKLLMLGPVIERLFDDLLDPLIDRTFSQLVNTGVLPEPPEELQGRTLRVNYISTLAQAQRAIGTGTIERVSQFVGGLAAASGNIAVWDKFDLDQAVDEYGHLVGVSPKLIIPDEVVAEIRQQRAAQQAEQQQQAQMMGLADAAAKGSTAIKNVADAGNSGTDG